MRVVESLLRDLRLRAAFLGLWLMGWGVTLYLSLRPNPDLMGVPDKLWHLVGYALMTLVTAGFCHAPPVLVLLALATIVASGMVECMQGLLPYRSFELLDLAANTAGAMLGGALALLWVMLIVRGREQPLRQH